MDFSNNFLNLYALANIIMGIYNLSKRNKLNQLLTAVSGLHVSVIMFFGLGFLSYVNYDLQIDTIGRNEVLITLKKTMPFFSFGYFIISLLEYNRFKNEKINVYKFDFKKHSWDFYSAFFLFLAYIGLLFSESSFANSGIGTFVPVLNNFIYPVTILIIAKVEKRNSFSILLLFLLILFVGYNAFTSSWRSQLIMFSISILIGLSLRGRINYVILSIVGIIYSFFILPFQEIKKHNYELFKNDPMVAVVISLNYDMETRFEIFSQFLAERINFSREMAYVQNAIDDGKLQYRDGETYIEVLYQLIPREFWNEKPIYNKYTGGTIPRTIQLLPWTDLYTSWAVNSFAEFIYNFPYQYLPLFSIVLYLFLSFLDRLCVNLKLEPELLWMLQTTLFFLSVTLVSVIFSSTYFLWTFLVIIFFDRIKKSVSENTIVRRI